MTQRDFTIITEAPCTPCHIYESKEKTRQIAYKTITKAQYRIALLVSQGLNTKEIIAKLHISRYTLKSHLRELYRRLNINNRVQLARIVTGKTFVVLTKTK